MTLLITDDDCEKLLSIDKAIPIIEAVFRMAGEGTAENVPRLHMPSKRGRGINFGLAALHTKQVVGFKLSVNFGSPVKHDYLYSMETSELLAIIQPDALSKFRTAATSAVAVKYLSPPTASVIGMYGTGRQAEAQLQAICAVRPIRRAHVFSRSREKREAFCRKMSERLGIEVIAMQAPELVPREADIIVTITNSVTPVLSGAWVVRPGLVIGAGANEWYEREIDEKLVAMAKLVVVDDREHSKVESGDLLLPIKLGLLRWDQVKNLGDVIVGHVPTPDFSSGIILFESHGLAIEDVAIAAEAYELAKAQGRGTQLSLTAPPKL